MKKLKVQLEARSRRKIHWKIISTETFLKMSIKCHQYVDPAVKLIKITVLVEQKQKLKYPAEYYFYLEIKKRHFSLFQRVFFSLSNFCQSRFFTLYRSMLCVFTKLEG